MPNSTKQDHKEDEPKQTNRKATSSPTKVQETASTHLIACGLSYINPIFIAQTQHIPPQDAIVSKIRNWIESWHVKSERRPRRSPFASLARHAGYVDSSTKLLVWATLKKRNKGPPPRSSQQRMPAVLRFHCFGAAHWTTSSKETHPDRHVYGGMRSWREDRLAILSTCGRILARLETHVRIGSA